MIDVLDWRPGVRLDISERQGLITVTADPEGLFAVTTQGHVRLRWRFDGGTACPLESVSSGRRAVRGLLVVYPPLALGTLLTWPDESMSGGEAS